MGLSWRGVVASMGCILAGLAQGAALPAKNLDFKAWSAAGLPEAFVTRPAEGYRVTRDCAAPAKPGQCAVRIEGAATVSGIQPVGQGIPVGIAAGHAAILSGFVRTQGVAKGAALWLRADGPGGKVFHLDNMGDAAPKGDTPWKRFEVHVPVPANTRALVFGAFLSGAGTAWFADLALTVDETVKTAAVEIPIPTGSVRLPVNGLLLDDATLKLPAEILPAVTTAWRDDVKARAKPIRSLASEDFDDLEFLVPLLKDKRVVQLGESSHGIAEFDRVKGRLVKFLHRRLGFDVIAFESSLASCHVTDARIGTEPAEDTMRGCIFRVWHAEETLPVFEDLATQRKSKRPLTLAGFDTQDSSVRVDAEVSVRLRAAAADDAALAARIDDANANLRYGVAADRATEYATTYDALAKKIEARRATPGKGIDEDAWLARSAWSRARYAEQLASPPGSMEGGAARDRGMADNLDFLLDRAYPGRKVIVWAHNFHVARTPQGMTPMMGTWVAQRRSAAVYTVGLFMGRGVGAQNDGSPYEIKSPLDNSLEAIMANAGWAMSFVDLGGATATSWRAEEIKARSWGLELEPVVPSKAYDAILYVDAVGPPQYMRDLERR